MLFFTILQDCYSVMAHSSRLNDSLLSLLTASACVLDLNHHPALLIIRYVLRVLITFRTICSGAGTCSLHLCSPIFLWFRYGPDRRDLLFIKMCRKSSSGGAVSRTFRTKGDGLINSFVDEPAGLTLGDTLRLMVWWFFFLCLFFLCRNGVKLADSLHDAFVLATLAVRRSFFAPEHPCAVCWRELATVFQRNCCKVFSFFVCGLSTLNNHLRLDRRFCRLACCKNYSDQSPQSWVRKLEFSLLTPFFSNLCWWKFASSDLESCSGTRLLTTMRTVVRVGRNWKKIHDRSPARMLYLRRHLKMVRRLSNNLVMVNVSSPMELLSPFKTSFA